MKAAVPLVALFTTLMLALAPEAWGAVRHETIAYQHGDQELQGYLAWDDAVEGPRPGVIVVHEWWGLNDYVRQRADMLAELGYAAMAIDMYGEAQSTEHGETAQQWMQKITADVETWQDRALRGLEVFRAQGVVDADNIIAIGYCFGGATVMQMAYAGAQLEGVASFHGALPPPPESVRRIEPAVFIAHGDADAFVPAERVQSFREGMARVAADWQMIIFGGARHAFTNPNADSHGVPNLKYDERADRRSWAYLQTFLEEQFGR